MGKTIALAGGYIVVLVIGFILGIVYRKKVSEREISSAEEEARRIINESIKSAESKKREALVEAKEEIHKSRTEYERAEPNCKSRNAVCSRRKNPSTARPIRSTRKTKHSPRRSPLWTHSRLRSVPLRRASLKCWRKSPDIRWRRPRPT